jgi:hypothetical protein
MRIIILNTRLVIALLVSTFISIGPAHAESGHTDLARQSQNPISTLISLPFESNNNFNTGPEDAYFQSLLIKPVVPTKINDNWNLINRAIMPVIYQEGIVAGQSDRWGLGDLNYQAFITPAKPGKVIWGVGPNWTMPTGSNRFSSNKLAMGPNAVALTMPGPWVIGALVQQLWDVTGDDAAADVSNFTSQVFVNYNFKNHPGLYVFSQPVFTANWNAPSDQRWTAPVGGGIGKITAMGKQKLNLRLAAYYNAVKPDTGSEYNIQASLIFLFPQ